MKKSRIWVVVATITIICTACYNYDNNKNNNAKVSVLPQNKEERMDDIKHHAWHSLQFVANIIDEYWYDNGQLPNDYSEIKKYATSRKSENSPKHEWSYYWSKPIYNENTGEWTIEISVYLEEGITISELCSVKLIKPFKEWKILTVYDSEGKLVLKDHPWNLACTLAMMIYYYRKIEGTWPITFENFKNMELYKEFTELGADNKMSFTVQEKQWIVIELKDSQTRYFFSTSGPNSGIEPKIVPR